LPQISQPGFRNSVNCIKMTQKSSPQTLIDNLKIGEVNWRMGLALNSDWFRREIFGKDYFLDSLKNSPSTVQLKMRGKLRCAATAGCPDTRIFHIHESAQHVPWNLHHTWVRPHSGDTQMQRNLWKVMTQPAFEPGTFLYRRGSGYVDPFLYGDKTHTHTHTGTQFRYVRGQGHIWKQIWLQQKE